MSSLGPKARLDFRERVHTAFSIYTPFEGTSPDPLHRAKIYELLREVGVEVRGVDPLQTISNCLSYGGRFENVARGFWVLRGEDGSGWKEHPAEFAGHLTNKVHEVLRDVGQPISGQDLLEMLRRERVRVGGTDQDTTLLEVLNGDARFVEQDGGFWTVRGVP